MNRHLLKHIILPFRSSADYYAHYFRFITQTMIFQNESSFWQIKWLKVVSIFQAFHFLYLGFPGLSDFERALHFDGCYLSLVPKYNLNKVAFVAQLMVVYYFDVLFLKPDHRLYSLLNDVLCRESSCFFGSYPFIKTGKFLPDLVKRKFAFVMHLFQSFLLITSKSKKILK